MQTPRRVLRFDAFTLDLSRCALLRDTQEVPLRRQAFDVLRYLAERPGRVASKEELVNAIWRKPAVSDDSLVRCVRDIREALGDRDHRIIETVRGRGYLFGADIHEEAAPLAVPPLVAPDADTPRSRYRWMAVRLARPSITRLALLAGSMAVVAGGVWMVRTHSAEPAPLGQAAHYAVLGRALLDREHTADANKEALRLFDKALSLDPNSMLALLGYARVMIVDVTDGWAPREEHAARLNQAEAAIERAIKLDPQHARAYLLRGFLWRARRVPERALLEFQRALALDSTSAWARAEAGRTKIDLGRAEEAINDIAAAIRLAPGEPRLFNWYYWAGMAAVHAGNSDVALRWFLEVHHENPLYYRFATPWIAVAYADAGRDDEGRALLAEYLARNPTYAMSGWTRTFPALSPQVAEQRQRIADVLRRLGVPEGPMRTGSAR